MKRLLSLILFAVMLATALLGCSEGAVSTTEGAEEAQTQANAAETESDTAQADPDDIFPVPEEGELIYSENFDSYTETADIIAALGWRTEGTADGACHDPTAKFTLAREAGGNRLYIENKITDPNDTYVSILSDGRFGVYSEESYTLQYDVEYTDASASDRYIGILTNYGGRYYDTFFLRNSGKGQHQTYDHGIWRTYDAKDGAYCSYTDAKALSNVLLGKKYSSSAQAFSGVNISIRYVVDREEGYRAYIRVNDEGYPASGKWVLVSETSKNAGAYRCFNSEYGYGIALKVGGAQNGYIDNILVWAGTADEPRDNTPHIDKNLFYCTLHSYESDAEYPCSVSCKYCSELVLTHKYSDSECECGALASNEGTDWKLDKVPAYEGGTYSSSIYLSGQSMEERTAPEHLDSRMMIVSSTNGEQYARYLSKLESFGYSRTFYREDENSNIYAQYAREDRLVYAYYTAGASEVRVIEDRASSDSIDALGYTYEKKAGESTYIYQYALPMAGAAGTENLVGNGMMYIVKCADNSLIVIDGGLYKQYDATQLSGLMAFMRQISGQKTGKVRVSAWYITHFHDDHVSGFAYFLSKYRSQISLERVCANSPSLNSPYTDIAKGRNVDIKLASYISEYYPSLEYIQLHTGQTVNIADVTLDVIYTHEDCTKASDASTKINGDYNNTSTVVMVSFDGADILITGDMNTSAMYYILSYRGAESVKCDVIQVAHHGYNEIYNLYNAAGARAVFYPQSREGAVKNAKRLRIFNSVTANAEGMIFYAAESTACLSFSEDSITSKIINTPIGGAHTGWSW